MARNVGRKGGNAMAELKLNILVTADTPSNDSHNAPSARYRQPVDRLNQRRGSADKINGNEGGSHGPEKTGSTRGSDTSRKEVTFWTPGSADKLQGPPHRSTLNPAAAWPFTRSEPESDQEWRNNAPEAAY